MAEELTIPDRSQALVGFRCWRLKIHNPLDREATVRLSPYSMSFYDGKALGSWEQDTLSAEADCYRKHWSVTNHTERMPDAKCNCGLHGFATLEDALHYTGKSAVHPPLIMGMVAVEGKVLRQSKGFRAEKATLLALFDPIVVQSQPPERGAYSVYSYFLGRNLPLPGEGCLREEYGGKVAQYVMPPKLKDVPLYLHATPFDDIAFLREWARARNCELYADSIADEPLKWPNPAEAKRERNER